MTSIDFQVDGKILYGGSGGVIRKNPDGSYDHIFSYAPTLENQNVQQVLALPDGSFLTRNSSLRHFFSNGLLEGGFTAAAAATVTSTTIMARQFDGKILSSSVAYAQEQPLVRLNPDGTRDTTFTSSILASDLALDSIGIYAIQRSPFMEGVNPSSTLRRFNLDGSVDQDFTSPPGNSSQVKLQSDGNLIVVGDFDPADGTSQNTVARVIGKPSRKVTNISARAHAGTGDAAAIGGFIVTGSTPKKVLLRALGPSMQALGVPRSLALPDPEPELRNGRGEIIGHNFNWRDSQETEIAATGLAPSDDAEAAILMVLPPGPYTAIVRGTGGQTGLSLVEVYDLDPNTESALGNVSVRGMVGPGDDLMIAGFVVRGYEATTVVLRGLGPSVAGSGVPNALIDPTLELRDQDGVLVAANDDWQNGAGEVEATGLAPAFPVEAAIRKALPAGSYTALLRDKTSVPKIGLIEVYRLP